MKGRLLVVGGSGFIGKHVVREALSLNYQVSATASRDTVEELENVEYIVVDLNNRTDLLQKLGNRSFHYVVNLSGYIDHADYFSGGSQVFDTHFNSLRWLIECIDRSALKAFIQIGSSDEYGSNSAPQHEQQRELPISPYSAAKTATTHLLQTLYRTEAFPASVLRLFLVYGPGQNSERFIPQIIRGCIEDKDFPVSKGQQLRDFCFVTDVVRAIFLAMEGEKSFGEVINIASGTPVPVRDVVTQIQNLIGAGRPQFGKVPYRVGENMELYADIQKANEILHWAPNVGLEQGLKETISDIFCKID